MTGVIAGGLFAIAASLFVFLLFQRQVKREREERERQDRARKQGPER